ncbi:FAD-binding protein [Sinorhizobium medicae]|nr:FAD-binding protein [Sinorhizobium medicae]MDX0475204.1 FAD-binding protein [Sinorhizobium medicae]
MATSFDVIVIGSGFGGAISARRLAEKGMRVLVLERGRRWEPEDYPRSPGDPWIFSDTYPARFNGWLDLRFFGRMTVALAAGIGGGSLAYSSVAVEAPADLFEEGWPTEITFAELKPYYDTVAREMDVQVIPDNQLTRRFKLARDAARNLGYSERFSKAGLAVSFSEDWHYGLKDAVDRKHSRAFINAHGVRQGTCVHLGNCDIGCDVRAKNSLDVNYIPRAEQSGAELRPLHMVRWIEPVDNGYKVVFDRLEGGQAIRGEETAARVVLAAGSVGTTELLLRCRDQYRTLPRLSPMLGKQWNANGNFLSVAAYSRSDELQQSTGPAISGVIDFSDGSFRNQRFVVEDDGFPNFMLVAVKEVLDNRIRSATGKRLLRQFEEFLREDTPLRNLMVWLACGKEAGDAELYLKRRWYTPWKRVLDLHWSLETSEGLFEAARVMHENLTAATAGRSLPNPFWGLFRSLLTLHPLGGCRMGDSRETGVVDHLGRVIGYPGLIVADGAIVPTAIVRNPSHTIAALAERIAAHAE